MRKSVWLLLGLVACGGTTEAFRAPSIAFDQASYSVTLNAAGTAALSKPTPVVTITRGSDALPPILSIGLDPAGYCNVGAGVGFASTGAQWTIKGTETAVSETVDFSVCPTTVGSQTVPKGSYPIHATYTWAGKTYTAAATVLVQ